MFPSRNCCNFAHFSLQLFFSLASLLTTKHAGNDNIKGAYKTVVLVAFDLFLQIYVYSCGKLLKRTNTSTWVVRWSRHPFFESSILLFFMQCGISVLWLQGDVFSKTQTSINTWECIFGKQIGLVGHNVGHHQLLKYERTWIIFLK